MFHCISHQQELLDVDRSSGNTMFSMAGKSHSVETISKMSSIKLGNTHGRGGKGKFEDQIPRNQIKNGVNPY